MIEVEHCQQINVCSNNSHGKEKEKGGKEDKENQEGKEAPPIVAIVKTQKTSHVVRSTRDVFC